MKIINLKIAIVEYSDIVNKDVLVSKITNDDLYINVDDKCDLVLLEGAYKFHPEMWKNEKEELLKDIKKLLSTDKTCFNNLPKIKK